MISRERFHHYETGYKEVDECHYNILQTADEIMDLLTHWGDHKKHEECSKCINFLNFLQEHINAEEILMERVEFPYRNYHSQNHNLLLNQIKTAIAHYKENNTAAVLMARKIHDVGELLIKHIEDHDLQFYEWNRKNEL